MRDSSERLQRRSSNLRAPGSSCGCSPSGSAEFAEICIFVSSNTGDFANPGSTNLHAQLAASFNPVGLRYAVSLADAESVLAAAGWVP
jgi:hypothetical protein